MNNATRITALDSLRKRNDRAAMADALEMQAAECVRLSGAEVSEQGAMRLLKIAAICAGIAFGAIIAYGLWSRFATSAKDDAFTRETIAECQAQGMVATVERSQSGAVLGVRCNRRRDVIRP